MNTLKKEAFKLDFDRSPQSIYSQINRNVKNSKDQGQKMPQSKKIDLRMFCEKTPSLIHYF